MSVDLINTLNTLHSIEPLDQKHIKNKIKIEREIAEQVVQNLAENTLPDSQLFKSLPREVLFLVPEAFANEPKEESIGWLSNLKVFFYRNFNQERLGVHMIQYLQNRYSISDELFHWIRVQSAYINELFNLGVNQGDYIQYLNSSMAISDLALRCVLLQIARLWNKENNDQPILWQVSECLEAIASQCSGKILVQTVNVLIIIGQQKILKAHEENSVDNFLADANEDKNGNILDNLLISMEAYKKLVESGWQVDQLEIENFQMTIDLFLQFLERNSYSPVEKIGEEIMINLEDSLSNFRYSGSPFLKKTDQKCVKVIASGWKYQDHLVIRPKVREIMK